MLSRPREWERYSSHLPGSEPGQLSDGERSARAARGRDARTWGISETSSAATGVVLQAAKDQFALLFLFMHS